MLQADLSGKRDRDAVTVDNPWDLYLRRVEFASRVKQGDPRQRHLEEWFAKAGAVEPTSMDDIDHIVSCSFHQFYSQFSLWSAGPVKGMRTIVRRKQATVVLVKPNMHRLWLASGHDKRREYCRTRLMQHKVFIDRKHYTAHMSELDWDFEAAYEEFGASDDAPQTVRDDFQHLELEEEGEVVENEADAPQVHGVYGLYLADRAIAEVNQGTQRDSRCRVRDVPPHPRHAAARARTVGFEIAMFRPALTDTCENQ